MQNPVGFATARASLHCKLTGIARLACLRNAPAGAVTVPELKAIPHNSRLTAQAPLRGCGTASALPKCSIMSGCGTRIVHRGQKPLALCDRCPCFGSLHPPLAALTFAASSIICAFGLASAAPRSPYRHLELCGVALNKFALFTTSQNTFLEPFETLLTLLLIFFICRIFLSSPISLFPLKPKTSPFPAGFTRQRERGCFLQIQTQSAITLHQAGSPATAGWPSTQWITFLGHLVTQVPQEEHLA